MRGILLAATAALAGAAPSLAQANTISERGGWLIGKGDDLCMMTMEYEGPGESTLTLGKFIDGDLALIIGNDNWSARANTEYPLKLMFDDGTWYSTEAALGTAGGGQRGLITHVDPDFERHFRARTTLYVFLRDRRIDQLSLSGSAVALDAVNRCLVTVRAEIEAARKERERWEHLPHDPFATAKPAIPAGPRGPLPRGNAGAWVGAN